MPSGGAEYSSLANAFCKPSKSPERTVLLRPVDIGEKESQHTNNRHTNRKANEVVWETMMGARGPSSTDTLQVRSSEQYLLYKALAISHEGIPTVLGSSYSRRGEVSLKLVLNM